MQAMFLTAGVGTRLRPYTEILPKPAIPLLNIPLLCYGLELLRPLRPKRIVGNLHHLPDTMKAVWESLDVPCEEFHLSDERDKILGGAGALDHARNFLSDESLFLINGDEVLLPSDPEILQKLWEHHHERKNIATLLCIEHGEVGSKFGGVWVDDKNRVLGFGKQAPDSSQVKQGLHFVGYLVLSPAIYQFIPSGQESNILYDAITKAIGLGHRAEAYNHKAHWFETGNPQDYLKTSQALLNMIGDPYLDELLSYWGEPYDLTNDGRALVSKSAQIPGNLRIEGFGIIGPQAILAQGTSIKNSVIGPGVNIEYPQHFEDQLILA